MPGQAVRDGLRLSLPLLISLFGIKLFKLLGMSAAPGMATLHAYAIGFTRLLESGFLQLTAAAGLLYLAWRVVFGPGRRSQFAVCLAASFVLAKIARSLWTGEWNLTSSRAIDDAIYEVRLVYSLFRLDIVIIACSALAAAVVLSIWSEGRARRWARRAIVLVQLTLLLIAGLELAHFVKTGAPGTGQELLWLLAEAPAMWFVLRSEADWRAFLALCAPFASLLAIPWVSRRQRSRPSAGSHIAPTLLPIGMVFWPVIAIATLTGSLIVSPKFFRFEGNVHLGIVRDLFMLPSLDLPTETIAHGAPGPARVFSTAKLTLVPTDRTRKDNVVLLLLESVRAKSTTIYNPALETTPFLRELATRSLVVDDMTAVSARTSSTWVSVLHGIYPATNSVNIRWGARVADGEATFPSLAQLLRGEGYRSAFFTPTHLRLENDQQIIRNVGFDYVAAEGDFATEGFERVNYFGWEDRIMLRPLREWISETRGKGVPFFATVMTNVGHHDYKTPSTWPKKRFPGVPDGHYSDYLNAVAYADAFVRQVFTALEETGVVDDTIVIVAGDHGESFGEHGPKFHVGVLYEEALRVPALIAAPGLKLTPGRITGPRQLIDLFPTIIDLLGYELAGGWPAGVLLQRAVASDRHLYFVGSVDNTYLGLRRGSMKFIYHFRRRPIEVFDLASDPDENRNLVGQVDEALLRQVEYDVLYWNEVVKLELTRGQATSLQ